MGAWWPLKIGIELLQVRIDLFENVGAGCGLRCVADVK